MSAEEMLAVAAKMTEVFEAGDVDGIAALYADDVIVWHNFDELERTREQALSSAAWVAAELEDFEIADLWVAPVEGGFVQQCVYRARERATGKLLITPAMLRVHVRDGRIARIEEYTHAHPDDVNIPDPD